MRDARNYRYEGENFATEKVVATLWVVMFVLIGGMGFHLRILDITPVASGGASPAAIEIAGR